MLTIPEMHPSDDVSQIQVSSSSDISGFPQSGYLLIDSEIFIYEDKNSQAGLFLEVRRAQWDTTAAAHTTSDTIYWIQHEIIIYYGDSSLSAPTVDDDYKPAFDLDNSTNTSWIYTEFGTDNGLNPGIWQWTDNIGDYNQQYTADRETNADPWEELGIHLEPGGGSTTGGAWLSLENPFGITGANFTNGEYIVETAGTYNYNRIYIDSYDGSTWTAQDTLNMTEDQSWHNWSSNPSIPAGTVGVRFRAITQRATSFQQQINAECADVTISFNSSNVPSITVSSEIDNYELECVISNETKNQTITITYQMEIDQTIKIDTETRQVSVGDQSLASVVEPDAVRENWVEMAHGENIISFSETSAVEVEVDILWRRRLFD